jgi:hypothetical protein
MSTNQVSIYPTNDVFARSINYFNVEDFFNFDLVDRTTQQAFLALDVWNRLHTREGIPLIEGEKRNIRADLKKLYPITLSKPLIEKYLGEFVGEIPRISLNRFQRLFQVDPNEPDEKMWKTYEVIVIPKALIRSDLTAVVDTQGKLKIVESPSRLPGEEKLLIPFSFPNLVELSKYPLARKEPGEVFTNIHNDVLDQCTACAAEVQIFLMRRNVLNKVNNYEVEKQQARANGLEIVPLNPRALSNVIKILDWGTCSDYSIQYPCGLRTVYARTSDSVQNTQVCIGNYYQGCGMHIYLEPMGFKYAVTCIPESAPTT